MEYKSSTTLSPPFSSSLPSLLPPPPPPPLSTSEEQFVSDGDQIIHSSDQSDVKRKDLNRFKDLR